MTKVIMMGDFHCGSELLSPEVRKIQEQVQKGEIKTVLMKGDMMEGPVDFKQTKENLSLLAEAGALKNFVLSPATIPYLKSAMGLYENHESFLSSYLDRQKKTAKQKDRNKRR